MSGDGPISGDDIVVNMGAGSVYSSSAGWVWWTIWDYSVFTGEQETHHADRLIVQVIELLVRTDQTRRLETEVKRKGIFIIHVLKTGDFRNNHGINWRNFISRWGSKPLSRSGPSLGLRSGSGVVLPPQAHHSDGDGIPDDSCRRTPLPAPVHGGD